MKIRADFIVKVLCLFSLGFALTTLVIDYQAKVALGTTITTIQGTDRLTDSRAVINTNFSNLNTDKLEITTFYATTSHSGISSLSSLATVGTITSGVWSGTAIVANKGGTSFTTYSTGDLIYASAANTLSKRVASTSNEVLTLLDGVPTWSSRLTISANKSSPLTANGLSYIFPPNHNASSSVLANNGSGTLAWTTPDF